MFSNLKNPVFTNIDDLNEMSRQIRRDIMNMLLISKSGHSGGPLGMADIFSALYFNKLNILPETPYMPERDFVFVSIGHIAPVWYSTLSRRGYFPLANDFARQIVLGEPSIGCISGVIIIIIHTQPGNLGALG